MLSTADKGGKAGTAGSTQRPGHGRRGEADRTRQTGWQTGHGRRGGRQDTADGTTAFFLAHLPILETLLAFFVGAW